MSTTEARVAAQQSLPDTTATTPKSAVCCPPFDPAKWADRELVWKEKPFVIDRVHSFLHVPVEMDRTLRFNQRLIEAAQAAPPERLTLADENSLWGG